MHSSYALSSDHFKVERGGKPVKRLADLWPGATSPGDRLGVVLAQPMDAVGCSNRSAPRSRCSTTCCASNTARGISPLLRHVPVRGRLRGRRLQPAGHLAAAQVGDHPAADHRGAAGGGQRPQGQPAGDPRDRRPLPRRGRALDLECVPGPRQDRRHLLAAHRPCARRGRRPCGQQGGGELRRAGHLLDPGIDAGFQAKLRRLRRNLDRAEKQPVEEYRTLPGPPPRGRCLASPRCCRPATRS